MWPFKKKPLDKRARQQEDYVALGKQVMVLYDHINPDRKGLYRTAFLKGIFTGVGSVVGATIVIALVAGILSLTGEIPFVGPISNNVRETLQSR